MNAADAARRGAALALVVALGLALGARAEVRDPARGEAEARAVVEDTIDTVLGVLRETDLPEAERRARIEEVAYARFDFTTVSRLVLARHWRRLSSAQRQDFVREFKRHLSLTYGKSLRDYSDEKVRIDSTRTERNGDVTVRTRILGVSAEPIATDYRLRESEGDWYMIDVIVEGVSLLQNFRVQTQEIISDVGAERLIELLREKNEARASQS